MIMYWLVQKNLYKADNKETNAFLCRKLYVTAQSVASVIVEVGTKKIDCHHDNQSSLTLILIP